MIDTTSTYGPGCFIHDTAVIGRDCEVGARVWIGPHVVMGADCIIGPGVVIGAEHGHERGVVLGYGVQVGANAVVSAGTRQATTIGPYARIEALVHVAADAVIGANVVVGHERH